MVTIPRSNSKQHGHLVFVKKIIFLVLVVVMSAGVYHWFALMMSLATGDMIDISAMETKIGLESKQSPVSDNINEENKNEIRRQMQMEKIHTVLAQISHLTLQLGKVTNQPDELNTKLSSFQSAIHKECLPGRDDSNGEINPTTHKSRECLRFVPLAKNNRQNESQKQRPRIGIMAPPGIISSSLSLWIADSLRNSQTIGGTATNNIELEIIPTSHVPVYGYGKSHGFTKLIRLVTLPIQLSILDAYLWAKYESSSTVPSSTLSSSLSTDPPSEKVLALALRLIMRWHCRLSHVSAHTSMLTVALDEILNDPEGLLNEILSFVWRYDWEWEGKGNDKRKDSNNLRDTTKAIISSEYNEDSSFELLLKRTSAILGNIGSNKSSSSMISNVGFQTALVNAFKEEMMLSKDLTKWPCPSFWEGIDDLDDGNGESNQDVTVLRRLATQMVPNCQDGDPFVRCTVNRDRCEVAGNANCK